MQVAGLDGDGQRNQGGGSHSRLQHRTRAEVSEGAPGRDGSLRPVPAIRQLPQRDRRPVEIQEL